MLMYSRAYQRRKKSTKIVHLKALRALRGKAIPSQDQHQNVALVEELQLVAAGGD